MRFTSLAAALLLPLLAIADGDTTSSTTTITSTATLTKTITVSQVYAVTSTYASNSTTALAATGSTYLTASASPTTKTLPANYMGAATSLNGMYAGGASVLVMIAAALL